MCIHLSVPHQPLSIPAASHRLETLLFIRVKHEFRANLLIKLLGREKSKRDSRLLERGALLVRLFGTLCYV